MRRTVRSCPCCGLAVDADKGAFIVRVVPEGIVRVECGLDGLVPRVAAAPARPLLSREPALSGHCRG